jgi:predicted ATP-grasp superfamily ATP-dependent carboligase
MRSVLVTDGDERAALAVVRSLGRAGYAVHVCGTRDRPLAAVSRRALRSFVAPDPLRAPGGFVATVAGYVATHRIDVILPITEAALLAVLGARGAFDGAAIPFPSIETFRAVNDKRSLSMAAARLGIRVPCQWEVMQPDDLASFDTAALPYPVVIKPARSVSDYGGIRAKHTVRHAQDADQFRARAAELPASAFPLLVQQRVIGAGCGVFLLRWANETVAAFAHRRIREKPPAGGVSVYAEAVPLNSTLVQQSEQLLASFAWQGVAMIEYKMDEATDSAYLMEVNGRFWGSLQLAIDAGVDFPLLLLQCTLGEDVPQQSGYRTGTRGRWWWGEVDHVLARLRRSDAELALPPGSPTRRAVLADFLARWRPHERDAVFRLDDPLPFLYESARWLRRQ